MIKVVFENRTNDPVVVPCGSRNVLVGVNKTKEVEVEDGDEIAIKKNCPSGVLCKVHKPAKNKLMQPEKTKINDNGGSDEH